jgi:plasmid stability protein
MIVCMRTTINLPDALAEAAKARAAAEGRTFTSLVEQGLRSVLADSPDESTEPLPVFGSSDGTVLVDLDDAEAVWDALDAVDDRSDGR